MFWRIEDDSESNQNLSDGNFETSDENSEKEVISKADISIASTG